MELEEPSEDIKFRPAHRFKYPWQEWIDTSLKYPDKVLVLKRGQDYGVDTIMFRATVHQAAKRYSVYAKTAEATDTSLTVKFVKREDSAE